MTAKSKKVLAQRLASVLVDILTMQEELPKAAVARRTAPRLLTEGLPVRSNSKALKGMLKPCPVTGVLNSHRRFSYLMPEVRTPENLAKFKGAAKGVKPVKKARKAA